MNRRRVLGLLCGVPVVAVAAMPRSVGASTLKTITWLSPQCPTCFSLFALPYIKDMDERLRWFLATHKATCPNCEWRGEILFARETH